jgi:hypothetical protein
MAKIQNPIIGRASGKAGGMVFSKMYQNNVMRALPLEVAKSDTDPQKAVRDFITKLSRMVGNVPKDMLLELYPTRPADRSRWSELAKQIATTKVLGVDTSTFNFSNLHGIGNGPNVLIDTMTAQQGALSIDVNWEADVTGSGISANAFAYVFLFNTTLYESFAKVNEAIYEDEGLQVVYPTGWLQAHEISVFLTFQTTKFKPGAELAEARKAALTT